MVKKEDIKLIIYLDDDDQRKEKSVIILEQNDYGVKIRIWNLNRNEPFDAQPFILPWHRVLKIKDIGVKDD